ncbi:MAG TPA: type IV pilus twitching motility protein PilT [Polyangia bacterium]|jgi:pilus retraction protein PilT|nr:type IV pilus twitching motility protein PilT [Polyangia bacterium]
MAAGRQISLLGRIAVSAKLITQDQLLEALRAQDHFGPTKRLGDLLLDLGYVSPAQLQWLLNAQQAYIQRQRQAEADAERSAGVDQQPSASADGTVAMPERQVRLAAAPAPATSPAADSVPAQPPPAHAGPAAEPMLDRILAKAMQLHASDLHIHAGLPIQVRIGGRLRKANSAPLEPAQSESLILEVLTPDDRAVFAAHNDLDFAYAIPGVGRFRGSVYRQRRGVDAVFRPISPEPPTLEQLGLPSSLARLTSYHQGLVLVTGPAGCGKSSTLAALINLINEDRPDHIITVEDPIEFVHRSKNCVVNQRQVRKHTGSFASALRAALREDPDVIAIGELRDLETISLAITAAETGHLVLGTLHTNDAARTINRVLDAYPPDQQSQIRSMISESLRAIVSQRLIPTVDGSRRVPALEILLVNVAVANLIRDERIFQLRSVMQMGRSLGMCIFDDSLLDLVRKGTISKETARRYCEDPKPFA